MNAGGSAKCVRVRGQDSPSHISRRLQMDVLISLTHNTSMKELDFDFCFDLGILLFPILCKLSNE